MNLHNSDRGIENTIPKVLLLLSLLIFVPWLSLQAAPAGEFVPGQVLVKFKTSVAEAKAFLSNNELSRYYQAQVLDEPGGRGLMRLAVTEGREWAMIEALRSQDTVEYAEPNYLVHAVADPDDLYFGSQWGLTKINAPQAWDITTGGPEVVIAIIDTGIDLDHPDLDSKLLPGYDYVNDDPVPDDDHGHGSHCAGTAAAETNNGLGVAGVSWGARLMPVKILDSKGDGNYANLVSGIYYAVDNGARVLNMSLGGYNPSTALSEAVKYAHHQGCFLVAAGGNESRTDPLYPAALDGVVGVSATDQNDQFPSFSNHGSYIDVAAPGVDIYSTSKDSSYAYKGGTSMSTPFVAGLAALVWSVEPGLSNERVEDIIEQNADDLGEPGWDEYFGWGRLNAFQALRPQLALDTTALSFITDARNSSRPLHRTVNIVNARAGPLTWTATVVPSTTSWLTVSQPASGQASGTSPATLDVIATAPPTYGQYTATLLVSSSTPYIVDSPQKIDVTLTYTEYAPQMWVEPEVGGTLVYTDSNGLTTRLEVPGGAVKDTTLIQYTPMPTVSGQVSGFLFARHAFQLEAFVNGVLQPGFVFLKPTTITIHYADADVKDMNKSVLLLHTWEEDNEKWVPVETCGDWPGGYRHYPANNVLQVQICHLSKFALFGEKPTILLPVIRK